MTWGDGRAVWLFLAVFAVFLVGLMDDIKQVEPSLKFGFQFVAAFLLIFGAGIRIENMGGVLGFGELPFVASVGLTVVTFVGVVNAFNLIDGVDGLGRAR